MAIKACKPLRNARKGTWRCARHPALGLTNSLAIAHHLGLWAESEENAQDVRHILKGAGCMREDVYFQCADHGEEAA